MVAIKGTTMKTEFKSICDRTTKGEVFLVTRPKDENIVIISEKKYRQLIRFKAYADHLAAAAATGEETTNAEDTYPSGFFDLFGAGKLLGLDERPAELSWANDGERETL
ncbi:MAG: type II toxin-antitoxin system Phd/YefM family antitoxin [Lachnospiraceae bacterium]|nr:type II toxin-antitoxin system Phd/YefM family antitoxin [Lachnospiraceae bacterium]